MDLLFHFFVSLSWSEDHYWEHSLFYKSSNTHSLSAYTTLTSHIWHTVYSLKQLPTILLKKSHIHIAVQKKKRLHKEQSINDIYIYICMYVCVCVCSSNIVVQKVCNICLSTRGRGKSKLHSFIHFVLQLISWSISLYFALFSKRMSLRVPISVFCTLKIAMGKIINAEKRT
jgi:hypothetical protein